MARRWPGWLVPPWTPQLLAVRNRSLDITVTAAVTDANFSGNPALRCAACRDMRTGVSVRSRIAAAAEVLTG